MQRCNPASRFRTGENFPVVFRQIIEEALSHRPCSVRSGQKLLTGDLDCIGRTGVLYRGCENLQGVVFQQVVAVKKDSISAFRMCESGMARSGWRTAARLCENFDPRIFRLRFAAESERAVARILGDEDYFKIPEALRVQRCERFGQERFDVATWNNDGKERHQGFLRILSSGK